MRTLPILLASLLLLPSASALAITTLNQTQTNTHDFNAEGRLRVNETIRTNGSQYQFGYWNSGLLGNLTNATLTGHRQWLLPDVSGNVGILDTSGVSGDLPYASGADTFARLAIGTSGKVLSSDGAAPQWSTIESLGGATGTGAANRVAYWSDVDTLTSDTDLTFDGTTTTLSALALNGAGTLASGVVLTWGGDTNIKREGTGILGTDSSFIANDGFIAARRTSGTSGSFAAYTIGDTNDRWRQRANGEQLWGDGTTDPDTNLYRMAANHLKTDDRFTIGATSALVLEPTSSATLPAAVEGAQVYDTTNDVFKGGISAAPSYRTFAMLETANTWTAPQTFGTTATTAATITGLGVGSTATVESSTIINLKGSITTSAVDSRQRGFDVRPAFTADINNGYLASLRVQPDYNTNSKTGLTAQGLLIDLQQGTYVGTPDEAIALVVNCPSFATANFCADFVGGDIRLRAGVDLSLDTSTGSMFGTATTQKIGWWGATPVVRSTWTLTGADITDNSGGTSGENTLDAIVGVAACTPNACATSQSTANAVATLADAVDENTADIAALKTILSTYGLVG